jgi:hypothetical protein
VEVPAAGDAKFARVELPHVPLVRQKQIPARRGQQQRPGVTEHPRRLRKRSVDIGQVFDHLAHHDDIDACIAEGQALRGSASHRSPGRDTPEGGLRERKPVLVRLYANYDAGYRFRE